MDAPAGEALTDPAALAQRINSAGGAKGIAASITWLTEQAGDIGPAASAEDWAVARSMRTPPRGPLGLRAC